MRLLLPEPARAVSPGDLEELYATPDHRHLRLNVVASLDGAVEVGGKSAGLGGPADRAVFHALRGLADVILVGSGTVRAEDYGPARLDQAQIQGRERRGQAADLPVAVVSERAMLDPDARLFTGKQRQIVLTCADADESRRRRLETVADVLVCGDAAVDYREALDALASRGLRRVLCEGGPTVLTGLLALDLVDEFCLTHAPLIAGPGTTPMMKGAAFEGIRRATLSHLLVEDGMLLARYALHGASAGNS